VPEVYCETCSCGTLCPQGAILNALEKFKVEHVPGMCQAHSGMLWNRMERCGAVLNLGHAEMHKFASSPPI
jgi:hypothetical protein